MPLRWKLTWDDKADDWVGLSGAHDFARIMRRVGGTTQGQWEWILNGIPTSSFKRWGVSETLEAAKAAAEAAFQEWLQHVDLVQLTPCPIAEAPTDDPDRVLPLYCPDMGGWQTGVFFEGYWRANRDLDLILTPTHWLPELPEPAAAE